MKQKWKRAISPLLATLILVGITIAAGVTIYGLVFSNIGVLSGGISVQVVSIDLIEIDDMKMFSASIKNMGNKPVTSCTITVYGDLDTTAVLELSDIAPGQTKGATKAGSDLSDLELTAGKTYPVKIAATAADGSTFDKAITVTCTS